MLRRDLAFTYSNSAKLGTTVSVKDVDASSRGPDDAINVAWSEVDPKNWAL
jgi:hypothetical protein